MQEFIPENKIDVIKLPKGLYGQTKIGRDGELLLKSSCDEKSAMQVSVIIPTYNRIKDVEQCLDSIFIQTKSPTEILLVDDSENDEIENLVRYVEDRFREKGILLKYIKNEREQSLTIARNIGIENATEDIIFFFDSDVILDTNYIEEILRVYKEMPNAMGVQGLTRTGMQDTKKGSRRAWFLSILGRLYLTSSYSEKDKCRLFPSLTVSYPYSSLDEIINCEWLSGANQSYKKEILEEFRWDENLKKYSWGEDEDLPYRIFKKYPSSLFITPYAKLIHKSAKKGRHQKKDLFYMEEIYLLYLFYKNIDQNLKNKLIYFWSRIGRIALRMVLHTRALFLKRSESKLTEINAYMIKALFCCMRHLGEIKRGDLRFFNETLK